jgi:hypothetical protein
LSNRFEKVEAIIDILPQGIRDLEYKKIILSTPSEF